MEHKNELQNFLEQIKYFILTSLGYWYLYIIIFLVFFAFSIFKNRYSRNIYSIYTTIFIETRYYQPEIFAGGIPIRPGVNLENEIGKLTSYQLNYTVLTQLPDFEFQYFLKRKMKFDKELYKSSPIKITFSKDSNPLYNTPIFIKILNENQIKIKINKKTWNLKFGQDFNYNDITFMITKTQNFSSQLIGKEYYIIHQNLKNLAYKYSQQLKIDLRSPQSTILWLWMETDIPYKDIDYLNKLAEVYIKQRVRKKNEIAIKTIEFIDQQLQIFQDSLRLAEKEMTQFKNINLSIISEQANTANEQLKEIETKIKKLQIKKTFYNNLINILKQQKDEILLPPPSVFGINDATLTSLLEKLLQAIEEKNQALLYIKDQERIPLTRHANLKIQNIKNTIHKYLLTSIDYTDKSINDLEKEKQQLYNELLFLPIAERQYLQLNRKFEINNNIYTFLMKRRMEAGITLASSRPDAEIIDRALPETIRFKRRVGYTNPIKTIFLALITVFLIISIIYIADNKIKCQNDIERFTNIPVIGTIIENKSKLKIPVLHYPRSSIAEAFRSLRTNILYYMIDKPIQVILITSTVSNEGKTFVASNLAAIFAGTGKKTLLIEADLRKPKIQEYFNLNYQKGIVTFLIGEHSYEQAIFPTEIKNLYILPSGDIPPNPVELLEADKMRSFLEKLRNDFDFIIIDSPPVGIVTDALVLANYSDLILFVIRQLYSTRQSIKLLNELKSKKKLEHLAIVLNNIKIGVFESLKYGYGYSYGYGYGKSYGYGYYLEEENFNKSTKQKINKFFTKLYYRLFK